MFGIKLREKLIESRWFDADEIVGCTPKEIEALRISQGVESLPQVYVDYMLAMGKRVGHLNIENDALYPYVAKLKSYVATDLRERSTAFKLSEDTFVCSLHENFMPLCFHTQNVSDDPPVFCFELGQNSKGEDEARDLHPHLSRMLTWIISHCASTYSTSSHSRLSLREAKAEQEQFLRELGLA